MKSRILKYSIVAIVVVVLAVFIRGIFSSNGASAGETSEKVQLKDPVATKEINKSVSITIEDEESEEGEERVSMEVESLELRDEIVVQGKKATSVEGRSFLIFNLKLINPLKQGLEINTRNYLRLAENESEEWLAPDIHNDPVLVQAISTKPTRVGFPVDSASRKFRLQLGEISGEKEVVEIDLSR